MRRTWIIAAGLACAGLATEARGGFVATYGFTGLPGDEAGVAVDAQPPGVTFGQLGRGPGVTPNAGDDSINSKDWTTASAPDQADYYQFTISPGVPLNLASLAYTDRASATGPHSVQVAFGLDGFSAATSTVVAAYALPDEANHREVIDLSGFAALRGQSSAVTFRIFAFGASGTTGVGTYRLGIDASSGGSNLPANLVVTDSVASVPEPSSLVLVGVGIVGVAGVRRMRRAG